MNISNIVLDPTKTFIGHNLNVWEQCMIAIFHYNCFLVATGKERRDPKDTDQQ
jgi:hypothetical protein